MLFTSFPFVVFFTIFFFQYWLLFNKGVTLQNMVLLMGCYFFYAWWDWRYLFLLFMMSLIAFLLGLWIGRARNLAYRGIIVTAGIIISLGSLLVCKYLNFLALLLKDLFQTLGLKSQIHTFNIIVPLGISFYTFRIISYLLDVKNGKIAPTTNWLRFLIYVSFFPCVISGPIDRAGDFLPQLEKRRVFNYAQASDGIRQILWGLFKKVVVADNCLIITNYIFTNFRHMPASALIVGALVYSLQVYADFSGYSDMAIGLASLLGFRVRRNFAYPFFSQNIAEFWRRWHISLTSWLTDYVFTPLSIYFRDYGKLGLTLAIIINFTLIGIWHGANWTFVVFGLINGCFFIPLIIAGKFGRREKVSVKGSPFRTLLFTIGTFLIMTMTFIFFRSPTLRDAVDYISNCFSTSVFSPFKIEDKATKIVETTSLVVAFMGIIVMLTAEWLQKTKEHALQISAIKSFPFRAAIYGGILFLIISFCASKNPDFIYFKF